MNRALTRCLLGTVLLVTLSASARSVRPVTKGDASSAPIAFSDPDGQELTLDELSVKAAVHGMLSLTELELRFRNPQSRRIEGRFTCVLPAGAAISRFAKEVNGQLMEGEVVERLKANQVYDAILHEMRDPALLEQDQGNRFSARIFPIEANATVRLVLSYSRLLPLTDGVRTYTLPLRGLPTVGRFRFHGIFSPLPGETATASSQKLKGLAGARVANVQTLDLDELNLTPEHDVELSWRPAAGAPNVQVLTAGDFVLTAFRSPGNGPRAAAVQRPWVFFVDTSASGAEGMVPRAAALEAVLAALPANDEVELIAFDQEIEPLGKSTAALWAKRVRPALEKRGFLGGTDLQAALTRLARIASERPETRFVLVSDGVATLGKTSAADLISAVATLKAPLSALVLGSRQDEATLRALVASRGRIVTVPLSEGMAASAADAARRLALPVGMTLRVADPSAEWAFPHVVSDVQAGSEVVLLSKRRPGAVPRGQLLQGEKVLLSVTGAVPLPTGAFEPLLQREAYRAYLEHLAEREATEKEPAVREALANEQVKVSVAQRVLIPRTTLLVLESEADYLRFGLDRRALAGVLTVGVTGVERLDRKTAITRGDSIARSEPNRSWKGDVKDQRPADESELKQKKEATKSLAAAKPASPMQAHERRAGEERRQNETNDDKHARVEDRDEPVVLGSVDSAGVAGGVDGGVEGGVAGGVPGGVSGGVTGGVSGGRRNAGRAADNVPPPPPGRAPEPGAAPREASGSRNQAATGLAESPRPVTRSVTGPGPVPGPAWTVPFTVPAADVDRLQREVDANPRLRSAYNALSEALLVNQDWKRLRDLMRRWQPFDPENPHVYECLGEAALKLGYRSEATRAFGSLVEIAPGKVELLQRAGLLLFRAGATRLAEAPLRKALELRPDRVNAYRHLALVLWQEGRLDEAAQVLERARKQTFPGWYGNAQRVVAEELAYVYRAILEKSPSRDGEIRERARQSGANLEITDALRVTLAWETDANDVDLHVVDPRGEECFYSHRGTGTGLSLYEDITRGFGPEVIRTQALTPGTYSIGVNYFSSGPMGVSRGVLVVMRPGAGKDALQIVPFRLVEGGRDMRLLARVEAAQASAARKTVKIAR